MVGTGRVESEAISVLPIIRANSSRVFRWAEWLAYSPRVTLDTRIIPIFFSSSNSFGPSSCYWLGEPLFESILGFNREKIPSLGLK